MTRSRIKVSSAMKNDEQAMRRGSVRVSPADCPMPPAGKQAAATKAYVDPSGALVAGVWRSKPGRLDVAYKRDEFCQIIEGEVHLTDAAGHTEVYRAGDAFVVPAGFTGVWLMPVAVTKFYVLHGPEGGDRQR
jgi:uncharacterized cupin superfamily protein